MSASDVKIEEKYDVTKSFATFLPHVDDGAFEVECTEKLTELLRVLEEQALATCRNTAGRLTVTLDFKVDEKGNTTLHGDVAVKKPKPKRGGTHMWLLKGKLSNRNPRQVELALRDVSSPTRVVDTTAPAAPAKDVK